jgi:hypothetical protein
VLEPDHVSVDDTLLRETRGCSCSCSSRDDRRTLSDSRIGRFMGLGASDVRIWWMDEMVLWKRGRTSSSGSVRWSSVRCLLNAACGPEVDVDCSNGVWTPSAWPSFATTTTKQTSFLQT